MAFIRRVPNLFAKEEEEREFAPEDVRVVPSTDPQYKRITIGLYSYTKNIEEDRQVLAAIGFNITSQVTGKGGFNEIMFGYFGVEARVAVKYIDFDQKDRSYIAVERREWLATEKYILSKIRHPNVVPILMVLNMGN